MTEVCTGAMARTVIIDEARKYTRGIALSELNSMISSAYISKRFFLDPLSASLG
jgi:hypothetical protein